MERFYCGFEEAWISKCWLDRGQEKVPECDKCTYYKKVQVFRKRIENCLKEIDDGNKLVKKAIDQGTIRLGSDSSESRTKSKKAKMPKEIYVKDRHTGKKRRLRFDIDYEDKNKFQQRIHSLCERLARQYGWEDKDSPPKFEIGTKICMKMPIEEIMKQPEMRVKAFKRFKPRTFAKWRREYFEIDKKQNPILKIYVGRPKKSKIHSISKTR